MTRTCALCGERDATTVTDLDGRPVPACARCLAPVRDPSLPPVRVAMRRLAFARSSSKGCP